MRISALIRILIVLSVVLIALILSFIFGPKTASQAATILEQPFIDVPLDHPNLKAIEYLKTKKVINGYPDKTFKPENTVLRAEALKMIMSQAIRDLVVDAKNVTPPFTDVKPDAWFFAHVFEAKKRGLVRGFDDNTFRPENLVKLSEALKIAVLSNGFDPAKTPQEQPNFSDVLEKAWFAPFFRFAWWKWILIANADATIQPEHEITRAELAELLYRLDRVKNEKIAAFPFHESWENYENTDNFFRLKLAPQWKIVAKRIIWHPDPKTATDEQIITSLSAAITLRAVELEKNATFQGYFQQMKQTYISVFDEKVLRISEKTINGMNVLAIGNPLHERWFFALPNNMVLSITAVIGKGPLTYQLEQETFVMVRSIEFFAGPPVSPPIDIETLRQFVKSQILIEKKGKAAIDSLGDATVIEVDPIGVGTGPVDYFYSAKIDLTIKYERSSDVILDVRIGKTTKF